MCLAAAAFRTMDHPCSGRSLVGASAGRNSGPAAARQNACRPQPAGWQESPKLAPRARPALALRDARPPPADFRQPQLLHTGPNR